jgi:hypothetical protein
MLTPGYLSPYWLKVFAQAMTKVPNEIESILTVDWGQYDAKTGILADIYDRGAPYDVLLDIYGEEWGGHAQMRSSDVDPGGGSMASVPGMNSIISQGLKPDTWKKIWAAIGWVGALGMFGLSEDTEEKKEKFFENFGIVDIIDFLIDRGGFLTAMLRDKRYAVYMGRKLLAVMSQAATQELFATTSRANRDRMRARMER